MASISKSFRLLALLAAVLLLISSEVAGRDLPDTTTTRKIDGELNGRGGYNDQHGHGRHGGHGGHHCSHGHGCSSADEVVGAETHADPHN
ncbi:hypothetical protein V6N11_060024 [Hibiscus sabdariffa]|uniref:Uncharacterized protein n=2 Tax=Hibiscus sabdariffa TaxID=183260 RepID=A0ABR2NYW6_9ROSI